MTQGELNLYRNTFEDGKRTGIRDFAKKIKEELGDINMDIFTNEVKEIIDKHLKEALDETK